MRWIGWAIFRAAEHGEDNRFEEEQSKAGSYSGNDQAALAHGGEDDEVQRDEQGGEGYGGAPGSGVNGSGINLTSGEEVDRAMRDEQNQQGKQNAAGIETPGKKQSSGEPAEVVEGQRGRDLGEQRAVHRGRDLGEQRAVHERRRQRQ